MEAFERKQSWPILFYNNNTYTEVSAKSIEPTSTAQDNTITDNGTHKPL
jgi:hypothetical protein